MARAAVPGRLRLAWQVATLTEVRDETPTTRTLVLDVPDWPGHLAGQHVDVRLTAPDGYTAQRSYSIANAYDEAAGSTVELTVQTAPDGEVSPYLTGGYAVGDPIELRGPVGGWFVWRAGDTAPVLLVAGGSGIVPLMAMIRARRRAGSKALFRLIYSARSPEDVIYADELRRRVRDDFGLDVALIYTRKAPDEARRPAGRIGLPDITTNGWPVDFAPACFVCGPTGFVETVADILVALGHDTTRIKTERFGPTGS